VIRLFQHYVHRRVLLNVMLDFAISIVAVLVVALMQIGGSELALAFTATHGTSLATCVLFANTASGFYKQQPERSLAQSLARAAVAALVALPAAYALFTLLPPHEPGHGAMLSAAIVGVLSVMAYRVFAAHAGTRLDLRSRIAILGSGAAARTVGETLRQTDPYSDVVGYFQGPNETQPVVAARELLPQTGSLVDAARRLNVREIVVALSERRGGGTPLRELLDCKTQGIAVSDLSTHFEKTLGQIRLDYVNAGWLVFGDGFNQGVVRTAIKRAFDLLGTVLLLAVLLPVCLLVAALIRIESRGPVLYRQPRVGFNGRVFDVVKFRSMVADAESDGQPRWATAEDSRITRVGRVIRLLRIDEVPQLWNVLKGEMSLVGPRPERPYFVDQLTREIPYYAVRHSVKPGVTGWAQVRYHYGATVEDSQAKLQYDLYYVKNHTLFLDLLILFETVAVVLTGKGAR
jgi:sugar transferase (PEP-CTERM system associated)